MIWLWLFLVVLRVTFYFEINLLTGRFLTFLPDVTLFLALMGTLLHYTVRHVKESTGKPTLPVAIAIASAFILWGTPLPVILGAQSRLLRKEDELRGQVAAIESIDPGRIALLPHVDPGPPLRVAFSCGLLDGRAAALVHDPSRHADRPEARSWFRGTLHTARPVRGDWFLVTFKNAPPKKSVVRPPRPGPDSPRSSSFQ